MKNTEIRTRFLAFFAERHHAILPSASLVPDNDPTVLFTTAGMHPLVPYLLGQEHPEGNRLASVQKCVRTGDIEEVGDNRHLTFFEMLGNWSLGDYFKKETIAWSAEFLTSQEKGLGFDPVRLYVTVFAGDTDAPIDSESTQIWKDQFAKWGIDAGVDVPLSEGGRIFSMPKDSNWWGPAGKTGPCGPDTEMYLDLGEGFGALTDSKGMPDFESGRLVEIWNDVFMQYQKNEDGSFTKLAQHNVDTGAGLDRLCMFTQNVPTVFQTDLFASVMSVLENELSVSETARQIIADHIRTSIMLIGDGVVPSNKDRGYVLRRLIRRAILHAESEGTRWLTPVVQAIVDVYADTYPELILRRQEIIQILVGETQKFLQTLARGKKEIQKLETLTAKEAFNLYQSFGFPWELSREYASQKGIQIEEADFEKEFQAHRDLSRTASAGQFSSGLADHSEKTVQYHTATHLLHQALRTVLGDEVQQKGSNITPERLRFDFSYPEKLTADQLKEVETMVNDAIGRALPVTTETMSPDRAHESGALGFFGHKYGDTVSVYTMGDFSKEICTGPHVKNTGELGHFQITKEESVSSGVRRIKAILNS